MTGDAQDRRQAVQDLLFDDESPLLFADGFDDQLLGVVQRFGMEPVALYDMNAVIRHLESEFEDGGLDPDSDAYTEALDYFGYNVIGAWLGEKTPAFAVLLPKKD